MGPLDSAPNVDIDPHGNRNWHLEERKSGHHEVEFNTSHPHVLPGVATFRWAGDSTEIPISNLELLLRQNPEGELGAVVADGHTTFALFAPRAKEVTVSFSAHSEGKTTTILPMERREDGVWRTSVPLDLDRHYYSYRVAGDNVDSTTNFVCRDLLDPYALATVGPRGPGIVVRPSQSPRDHYQTPPLHDMVILEAHVRDLTARTRRNRHSRFGFKQLIAWLRTEDNYVRRLGVNAVELQPISEFDYSDSRDYHWGYMPAHYFSPSSAYASHPREGSQVLELRKLIHLLHRQNVAVILDVVYNHAGCLNSLENIEPYYYFMHDAVGRRTNASGCGNDLRTRAPAVTRLILDSLKHWILTYNVDGFRFDLAELLGKSLLLRVEEELRALKPSVILIAEPWSFRRHVGYGLQSTTFSSWNDGYREFFAQYVLGRGNPEGFRYFLKGSTDYLTRFPAQSVNYIQSHDDRCWIDKIAERPGTVTTNDIRRTHLAFASLLMSLGVPMMASGQDFAQSKDGISNTYDRGDLNALDYERRRQYPGLTQYVQNAVAFRLSSTGQLLRRRRTPPDTFWKFFFTETSAVVVLYNADHSAGPSQLLFAINPHLSETSWNLGALRHNSFQLVADTQRFCPKGLPDPSPDFSWNDPHMRLAPLSCALWRN
jgi:pullulanase/glycogen debranching enzyme